MPERVKKKRKKRTQKTRIWDANVYLTRSPDTKKPLLCPCGEKPLVKDIRSRYYCVECPNEHGSHWTGPIASNIVGAVREWNEVMGPFWAMKEMEGGASPPGDG